MRLFKDAGIYVVGELISKALPFLLLPYLTRKLGVAGFGELSYYQALISLLLIFLGFSQHGAVIRYYYVYGKRAINMIVTAGYLLNGLVSLLLITIFLFFQSEILIYVTLVAMFQTLINVQLSVRQCQKRALHYVCLQFGYSALNVLCTIFLLEIFSERLVEKRLLAMLLAGMVAFVVAYYFYIKELDKPFRYSKRQYFIGVRYILFFGLPLFLHGLSGVLRGQFDKILIYSSFSEVELGIYSAGFQIASVLSVIIMATNKAITPYYYEAIKLRKLTEKKIFRYFFLSFIIVPFPALIAWLAPESWYLLFLGKGFDGSYYFTILFLLAMGLNIPYLILVNFLFYHGKNLTISFSSIFSTVIYILLLLILRDDVNALPYASIFAELLILPVLYFFCMKVNKLGFIS